MAKRDDSFVTGVSIDDKFTVPRRVSPRSMVVLNCPYFIGRDWVKQLKRARRFSDHELCR